MNAPARRTDFGLSTIRMTIGDSAAPTAAVIADAAARSLAAGETFYPLMAGLPDLRAAIADYVASCHGLGGADPARFVVTSGGTHALSVAMRVAGRGEVAILTPSWCGFWSVADAVDVQLSEIPLSCAIDDAGVRWSLDLDRVADAFRGGVRVLVVNTPNNPTGWVASRDELAALLDLARHHGAWIVADEIYGRFAHDGARAAPSFHDVAEPDDEVLYAQSFSKNWAMTGWRLGWIEVPTTHASRALRVVEGTSHGAPTMLQRGALAALEEGEALLDDTRRAMTRKRDALVAGVLAGDRLRVSSPDAGPFLFVTDPDRCGDGLVASLARDAAIAARPGRAFGLGGAAFARLSFTGPEHEVIEASDRIASLYGR